MFCALLVPCDDPEVRTAAMGSGADALVLDLGDADAPGERAERRAGAAEALRRHRVGGRRTRSRTVVRVSPLATGLLDADLDAVMAGAPDAVMLPGAVGAGDLQHLAAKLAVREAVHGLDAGRTRIVAVPADTAAGVLALPALSGATPRLLALVWDAAALAARLGIGAEASPVRAARDLMLIAAAAAGVLALDGGGDGGLDGDDLTAACRAARRIGFAGRVARRAQDVETITAAFDARP